MLFRSAACSPETLEALAPPEAEPDLPDWLESTAQRARRVILDALTPGPVTAQAMEAAGNAAGLSKWVMFRAGKKLGLKKTPVRTHGFSGKGYWLWSLPERRAT